jgi:hypothetical protein
MRFYNQKNWLEFARSPVKPLYKFYKTEGNDHEENGISKRIPIAVIVIVIVVMAFFVIGGCGGGGDGNDGDTANPLFNGTHRGFITTTQGDETISERLTVILSVGSPLSGVVSSGSKEFAISADAVGNLATFSGTFDTECPGAISGTLELIPEDTILFAGEGSDCDGLFSSIATLTRCFTGGEIADSDCPAEPVLEVCEPYFCGGCKSDHSICFDFLFPIMYQAVKLRAVIQSIVTKLMI